jgi:predicted nucleic acid-binding protein
MGLILDSTTLLGAERNGLDARRALTQLMDKLGSTDVGISVVTTLEFAHGIARADTPERKAKRQAFLDDLLSAVPVYPVSLAIALRAGQIDGTRSAMGLRIALGDLLIGVTALETGFDVATANVRHFQMIPGLDVVLV